MRIVFAGTPEFATSSLQRLWQTPELDVVGVVSQPDRPAGRGMRLRPSPVKVLAQEYGLPCITPKTLRDDPLALEWLRARAPDFLVVVAFGMLLPKTWLEAARIAPINVHASLLPRWRGAAPIERALLAGDSHTGVCIMRMEEGLDTGPVYCREEISIDATSTAEQLRRQLQECGARLLVEALPNIAKGRLQAQAQATEGVCYARKLTAEDRKIDWRTHARHIDRQVRCFTPKPGARCRWRNGWLKILSGRILEDERTQQEPGTILRLGEGIDIACGHGSCYRILQLQAEGKRSMPARDFSRGQHLSIGELWREQASETGANVPAKTRKLPRAPQA